MTKQLVALDHLNLVVDKALMNLSIDRQERDIIRQVLMYAEMRGSSQGLIKIRERTILPDKNCTDLQLENKTPAIARINGGGHTGMFVLHQATLAAARCVLRLQALRLCLHTILDHPLEPSGSMPMSWHNRVMLRWC